MALLEPPSSEELTFKRVTRRDTLKVRPKHRFVLELHLSGYPVKDKLNPDGSVKKVGICTLTGYSAQTVSNILNSKEVDELRQQINLTLDKEFQAQYGKVIQAVGDALDEGKPDSVRLQGAKLWGDFHKRFSKDLPGQQTINLTAEDVVFQIMNGDYVKNG